MRIKWLIVVLLLGLAACSSISKSSEPVNFTVSAAANAGPAFQEIGAVFEKTTGHKVIFNLGASGQLAQQIERGAPVDVFAAANTAFIDDLETKGLIIPDTKLVYAEGRITLWTRTDSPLRVETLPDLLQPAVRRIAIANPDTAPYGAAAREALQKAGLWDKVQAKLVFGQNIEQTLQYADTGNVEVGIVAYSLSIASQGRWTLIPKDMHQPLYQSMAVIKGTKHAAQARQFVTFVNGPQGHAILRKYGFTLPNETSTQ